MAEAATECSSADRKACVASAKASFVKSGMKERQYKNVKKLGELMFAAEEYAACKQEEEADDACMTVAKEKFAAVSGVADSDGKVWTKMKAKITKLAQGIMNGSDIVLKLKMQLAVVAETSGKTCEALNNGKIVAIVKKMINETSAGKELKKIVADEVKEVGCAVFDGLAEYAVSVGAKGLTEDELGAAADAISSGLKGSDITRRLGEARRLVSVTGAFAAQEAELCASDDASCGMTDGSTTTALGKAATTSGSEGTFPMLGPLLLAMVAMRQ